MKMLGPETQPLTLPEKNEEARINFLRRCVASHIESFDFAMGRGLQLLPSEIEPLLMKYPPDTSDGETHKDAFPIKVQITKLSVMRPREYEGSQMNAAAIELFPSQCRLARTSYVGELLCSMHVTIGDRKPIEFSARRLGRIPVMVCSSKCNLRGLSPRALTEHGEEEYEMGGYFVVSGMEKLIRMIVVGRANHPVCARRGNNLSRGKLFTDLSLSMKCLRPDMSTSTFHLHYMRSGAVTLRTLVAGNEYFVPVGIILRALLPSETSEREIFELILGGDSSNAALRATALAIVVDLHEQVKKFKQKDSEPNVMAAVSRSAAICFIGRMFRVVLRAQEGLYSDYEAGVRFLRLYVCVHLSVNSFEDPNDTLDRAKADLLVFLTRKLVATHAGEIEEDNPDALSHQSILLPGHLYLMFLKDRLRAMLLSIASRFRATLEKSKSSFASYKELRAAMDEAIKHIAKRGTIAKQMVYFLSTGNIKANSSMDLSSTAGYTIIAERINYLRFMAHFRSIHRGAFYANMRGTKVRKLLPEAWGFVCPVHTPDGDPCGILNHLASEAFVTQNSAANGEDVIDLVSDFGVIPTSSLGAAYASSLKNTVPVVCDGRVLGYVRISDAESLEQQLRFAKVQENITVLPESSEIVFVKKSPKGSGFYPGIYIYTNSGRFIRPVLWLSRIGAKRKPENEEIDRSGRRELIGSLEQVFLRIRLATADQEDSVVPVVSSNASHAEISGTGFLSVVASLSPFPDMNQGPRNMFQCQMAKQAMGTPCHMYEKRLDSKVYRLTSPQVPITRNFCMQDPMGADMFCNGINAIVAVISYTGYDMEDALIINQGSLNRGFAHGTVYVNTRVDLDSSQGLRESQFAPLAQRVCAERETVDDDGLPHVGARLRTGDALYATCPRHLSEREVGDVKTEIMYETYKSVETATVDHVFFSDEDGQKLRGRDSDNRPGRRHANIRTRVSRTPSVGDKFASRAGQKGTVAAAWPTEDMPFSDSGMIPDILFNPHGFPSRMTIGMMVESMAGKGGALHGHFQDSTPFRFDEKSRAVDYFAEQLVKAGYNYYGNETLYSGYTGEPFEVDIFMGVVHYQRLRHMVSDKFQVRSTGKVHPLFRQPIKGRKRGGAIRFGEMERDGLLAHGASYLLRDRLGAASDMHLLHVCEKCGSLVSPTATDAQARDFSTDQIYCRICGKDSNTIRKVALPYSFKYLVNELVAMNIRTVLELKEL